MFSDIGRHVGSHHEASLYDQHVHIGGELVTKSSNLLETNYGQRGTGLFLLHNHLSIFNSEYS